MQKADENCRRRGRTWITRKAMHRKNIRSSSEGTDSSSQIQETEKRKRKKKKKSTNKKRLSEKKLERGDESSITKLLQVLNRFTTPPKKQRSADRTQTDELAEELHQQRNHLLRP